jgi:tetratricopeptide (TPR) repeat protein
MVRVTGKTGPAWAPACVAVGTCALVIMAACAGTTPDEHFRRAGTAAEQSRWSDAILEYRLGLQSAPGRGDVHLKLAEAYGHTRDAKSAMQEYARAADLLPADASAQISAGNVLLLVRGFEDAKARADKALTLDPKNADALVLRGNALAGLNDVDGAMTEYQQAIALDPFRENAYLSVATIQLVRGHTDEAEASFRQAVDAAPRSVHARLALASFLWASRRTPEAEAAFKEVLSIDPTNLAANRALGVFYVATNRANEAEPYFKAIAAATKTASASIVLADYYTMVRRFDEARGVLNDLAAKEATYAPATVRLAAVDASEGARAQALVKVRQVLTKYPKDSAAHLLAARLLSADGRPDESLAEAKAVVGEQANAAAIGEAYLIIGRIDTSADQREEAIEAYQEALKRQSQPLEASLALAALHLSAGELDAAMSYVRQAEHLDGRNLLGRALEVRVLLAQNHQAEAATTLAELQKEFPKSPTVGDLLAAKQLASAQPDAARTSYENVLQASPRDLEALGGLIRLDLAGGRTREAVAVADDALKSPTITADLVMLAGQTYDAAGNTAKAEELLTRAVEMDPARLQAYGLLGAFYGRHNRIGDAEDQCRKIVARDPRSIAANTMLAMLLEGQHRTAEAEQQYQKVLRIDPHAAVAANNLASIYLAANRLSEALPLAQTAVARMPNEPYITDTLGWVYYKLNMPSRAIEYLQASTLRAPDNPAIRYHLGMAYIASGEFDKAKKELERAVASKTEFDGLVEARKALAQFGS